MRISGLYKVVLPLLLTIVKPERLGKVAGAERQVSGPSRWSQMWLLDSLPVMPAVKHYVVYVAWSHPSALVSWVQGLLCRKVEARAVEVMAVF